MTAFPWALLALTLASPAPQADPGAPPEAVARWRAAQRRTRRKKNAQTR